MDFHDMAAMLLDHDCQHTDTPFGQEAPFTKGKGKFQRSNGKFQPFKCNHCGKLGHTEDKCFKKIAKQQLKDHANLVIAEASEIEIQEEDEDPVHAFTAHMQEIIIDRGIYQHGDHD